MKSKSTDKCVWYTKIPLNVLRLSTMREVRNLKLECRVTQGPSKMNFKQKVVKWPPVDD